MVLNDIALNLVSKGHFCVAKYLVTMARQQDKLLEIIDKKDKHKLKHAFSLVRGLDKGRQAWHCIHLDRRYVSLYQTQTRGGRVNASQFGTIVKSGWGDEPEAHFLEEVVSSYRDSNDTKDGQDDMTPVMLAIYKGFGPIALYLLNAGADAHGRDCYNQTTMHMAAMRGLLDVAQELEKQGVSSYALDEADFTPARVARENGHTKMANFFMERYHSNVQVSKLGHITITK